ncbi:MAG: beta-ketoacyl synthase chain length factor, partial [Rhodanobacteraceae bacterium]
ASDSVVLACEVAAQACAMAGRDASDLSSVFTSTEGDIAVTDYLCRTLAERPLELSPTRFHNSVHNAPAGYWSIASGCHAPSTAISASHMSFAAALLEAAAEALAEQVPVLLVAYDTRSPAPFSDVWPSDVLFGVALVVAPTACSGPGIATLSLHLDPDASVSSDVPEPFRMLAAANPMAAGALPLFGAIAANSTACVTLAGEGGPAVVIEVQS